MAEQQGQFNMKLRMSIGNLSDCGAQRLLSKKEIN